MARTYANGFKNALAAGTFDPTNAHAIVLCSGVPGTASGLTNAASVANGEHTEAVTISRSNNVFSLAAKQFTPGDLAAITHLLYIDTTADMVLWFDDGYSLDPGASDIVDLQAQANLLTIG